MDVIEKLISLIEQSYYCDIVSLVEDLVSKGVTVQEWVPVTERLPELHTKVLCCGIKGGRFIAELSSWGHANHLYWTRRDGKCIEVVYWMPLPEPPNACHMTSKKPTKGE